MRQDDFFDSVRDSLQRASGFLLRKHGRDTGGLWRSETYGSLAGGVATTALVSEAIASLLSVPVELFDRFRFNDLPLHQSLRGGVFALTAGLRHRRGIVGDDGTADYPTYATALVLLADRVTGPPDHPTALLKDDQRRDLAAYLRRVQLTSSQGFDTASPHYGGWDAVGEITARGVTHGSSLSVTALVLDALATGEGGLPTPARAAAASWVTACQAVTGSGGFAFNPDPDSDLHKAGLDEPTGRPRPYGTMTLDGLRAALTLSPEVAPDVVAKAKTWLAEHRRFDRVPGFEAAPSAWAESLLFYDYGAWGRVLPRLDREGAGAIEEPLARAVMDKQQTDGSWQNPSALMREDDPLIATAFAITALTGVLRSRHRRT